MYLVRPLENGQYEIIDSDFLYLYPDIEQEQLVELSNKQYQQYLKKQNHLTTFENGQFVYRDVEVDETQVKEFEQAIVWGEIKQLRHDKTRKGCYVKSVDKWFHSDDDSRQQYIFMRTMPEIPAGTLWKTMDNSFIEMSKALLDELSYALFAEEQHNFKNAELHRAKMLQAKKPLDYDFSTGWSTTYEDREQ